MAIPTMVIAMMAVQDPSMLHAARVMTAKTAGRAGFGLLHHPYPHHLRQDRLRCHHPRQDHHRCHIPLLTAFPATWAVKKSA